MEKHLSALPHCALHSEPKKPDLVTGLHHPYTQPAQRGFFYAQASPTGRKAFAVAPAWAPITQHPPRKHSTMHHQQAQINRTSLRLYRAAWNTGLPSGVKFALLAICSHVNDDRGYAGVSVARIATDCSIHERTAQTHIRKLIGMGLVAVGHMRGMRVCAYRVCEEALSRAQVQRDFDLTVSDNVQDFSHNPGESFKKPAQITTRNGNELKEREERGDTAPPPPPAFASLPEVQTPTATAPADITPASLDHLNDQRIVNGKQRLRPADLTQLREQAALAGISPQTAVDWLLQSPSRNFFKSEFFRAPAQPVSAPTPASPEQPAPPAPAAAPVQPACPQAEAAAASAAAVARAKVSALLASAKAATGHIAKPTTVKTPAHGPQWARDAVAKALAGDYVAHITLRDACKVLGMCPKTVRASAAAAIVQ